MDLDSGSLLDPWPDPFMTDNPRRRRPRRRRGSAAKSQGGNRGATEGNSESGPQGTLSHREKRRAERRSEREAARRPRKRSQIKAEVHKMHKDEIDPRALDRDARRVVTRLQRHGFEAYFVGCIWGVTIGEQGVARKVPGSNERG